MDFYRGIFKILAEFETAACAGGAARVGGRFAGRRGRDKGADRRSDDREGFLLCSRSESREGVQLHL